MRSPSIALAAAAALAPVLIPGACLLAGCKHDEPAPEPRPAPAPHREVKRPIDKTPLPALAKDRSGATGKPLWATGVGGLGIDAPRGIATAPGGDSYVI